ncbi:type I-C CRISPR-associated protein Cas8c/Csd1 [Desulfoplanes formicivorans]|uniref:CRISPR-associated protein Csd1 n=1 Tax=Desulfoplanes formicivorans TaxID=1592317 RepID=A0A194AK52_9BACT|nr:type I-C CRISPR-associated protein Cas8c/Csd1 [Desulfoplanes formicivorans]GAU09436.1 CRISPR-associated protein Csd1 [Desulfoplanes formicivorans]
MILQALHNYYERMRSDSDSGMPPYGTSMENISFALVLDANGNLRGIEDLREQYGKKLRPRKMAVPLAEKKANGIKPNFLWDTTKYVLGKDKENDKDNEEKKRKNQERTAKCHDSFVENMKTYCDESDPGLAAVLKFLSGKDKDISDFPNAEEVIGTNVVFRLEGERGFVHDRPAARKAWASCLRQREQGVLGQCLVTGETSVPIARLHPSIKGVRGAQPSGASIVAFELASVKSYGKERSYNAPVSQYAAFSYVSALNFLLSGINRQRIILGDATIVFWAERMSPAEDFLADFFDPPSEVVQPATSVDRQTTTKIYGLLMAIRSGRRAVDIMPDLDESVHFYLLALAPNAARLSIRFWEVDTVGGLLKKVGKHFRDLEIVRQYEDEPEFPPLWRLLCQTAALGKSENISPVLAGGMARAMLSGVRYPQSLLVAVLGRIRSEHAVTYFRAALIKAFLIRNKQMEVPVSLDPARTDRPYLLGRLFAVLEKAQEEAVPGANATIKDRYLSSASATPGQVFHMLLKNAANHTAKLRKDPEKKKLAFHYDKIIQDIMDAFSDFPTTMSSEEQGLFMIGYYHQRKDFFTKKNKEN